MLIDLHTHTLHHSLDSGLRLETLLTSARQQGLDGVCLTEHNSLWSRDDLQEPAERHGLVILRGMEIGTNLGHVLVFGLSGFTLEMLNLYRLRRIVEEEGAAMVIAHPWRYNKDLGPRWDEVPDLFDAVEVYNGSDSNDANAYVARMVAERGLVGVGGSDAHSPGPVGSCATRLHDPIRDEADLIRALKGGSLEPVHLRRHHLRSKQFHRR